MFITRVLILIALAAVSHTFEAHGALVALPTETILSAQQADDYRAELLRIQSSKNACSLRMPSNDAHVFTGATAVNRLSLEALSLIYKMQYQLAHDRQFRHHVAGLIERDLEDVNSRSVVPTEYGGIGLISYGSIEMLPVPSTGRLALNSWHQPPTFGMSSVGHAHANETYVLPVWARESLPYVFEWHLHAIRGWREPQPCNPSYVVRGKHGDILAAFNLLLEHGKTHQFVMAKGRGNTYSVVYFGGEMQDNGDWYIAVIALPNVSYR